MGAAKGAVNGSEVVTKKPQRDLTLTPPTATLESLGLDSLAVIEFLFQIEDKFGIQIPDQANPPRTLGEMVQMIEPLLPTGKPAA